MRYNTQMQDFRGYCFVLFDVQSSAGVFNST